MSLDPNTGQTEQWDVITQTWTVSSFGGVSVPIWSGSGDPNVHTTNPVTPLTPQDMNGNGVIDGPFTFATHSLKDLGTYFYIVGGTHGQWQFSGYYDAYNNPIYVYVTQPAQNTPFDFVVTNSAPTASIAIGGTKLVGHTVTLAANSNDPDGGSIPFHEWSIVSKPAGSPDSIASSNQPNASINLTDAKSIGNWSIKLQVADNEGQLAEFNSSFTVPNQNPTVSITGSTSIDALQHIHLQADPATDADGESITWVWDITQAPPGASHAPQSGFSTAQVIDFVTGPADIGTWKFHVTASDGHGGTAGDDATVEVKAIPPQITIADTDIVVPAGSTIHFETTTLDDAYGAPLQFQWELLQVPVAAGVALGNVGSAAGITFNNAAAGTWKLKLTVTDQVNQTATKDVKALADGLPKATISGPDVSGNLTQALDLDGSGSSDPDSPTTPPDYGHLHTGPPDISPGITTYTWSLLDVPPEYYQSGDYYPGPVADVLGINGSSAGLHVPAGKLKSGNYVFMLEVVDGEGNHATDTHSVEILDEGIPPIADAGAPEFFTVDAAGVTAVDIAVNGSQSIDLDNLLNSPPAPGLGITNYAWSYVSVPINCFTPPALPSGAAASQAVLYPTGSTVPGPCQGIYTIKLTVTDDDVPTARQSSATTTVAIGNCSGDICIDYPLQAMPEFVKFSDQTDVLVFYHLNSILYDQAVFTTGLRLNLKIIHEMDFLFPTYENAWDVDLLPSDKGAGPIAIHWPGYDFNGQRPKPGKYSVNLQLLDSSGNPASYAATEQDAIWIQVIDIAVANTTDKYVDHDKLAGGTAALHVAYNVTGQNTGQTEFDQLVYRIRDATTNALLFVGNAPQPFNGSFQWNGDLGAANFLPVGDYKLELEILDQGASLGTSAPYPFTVYELKVTNPRDFDGNGKIDDAEEDHGGVGSEFTFWDPANRYHGSAAKNNAQLRIDCTATINPPAAAAALGPQVRWKVFNGADATDATGVPFSAAGTTTKWNGAAAAEGTGLTPMLTVDGMPAKNDDFGRKTVRIRIVDPANPATVMSEVTVPIEVFWPLLIDLAGAHNDANFAKNHPGDDLNSLNNPDSAGTKPRDGTRAPNWMFFWSQVVETNDGLPASRLRYTDSLEGPGTYGVTPAVFYFPNGYNGKHERVCITEEAQGLDADPDGAGPRQQTTGIDCFRDTVIHENHHAIDESVGFTNTGLGLAIAPADVVTDAHWSFNLAKPAITPAAPLPAGRIYDHWVDTNADGNFTDPGEDRDIDGDDIPNALDPHPAVVDPGDVGNLALNSEPDVENALAAKDWGNPGKRHRTDDNPNN